MGIGVAESKMRGGYVAIIISPVMSLDSVIPNLKSTYSVLYSTYSTYSIDSHGADLYTIQLAYKREWWN